MTRIAFHRPARIIPAPLPDGKLELPAPPQQPEKQGVGTLLMTMLLPLLTSCSMAAYMITFGKPLLILLGAGFVIVSVGAMIGMRLTMRSTARRQMTRQRMRYHAHLDQVRESARVVARAQRELAVRAHPSPERLWAIASTPRRLWERRRADPDFLHLRVGLGRTKLAAPLQLGGGRMDPMGEYDRQSLADAQHVMDKFGTVPDQPLVIDAGQAGVISLLGPPDATRGLARALVGQLAVLHSPDDVLLAARTGAVADWDWLKWLPHTFEPDAIGDAGVVPLVAAELDGIADFLQAELDRRAERQGTRRPQLGQEPPYSRRLVVLLDGYDPATAWARSALVKTLLEAAGPALGITVICLAERDGQQPTRADLRARLERGDPGGHPRLVLEGDPRLIPRPAEAAVPDLPPAELAELTARLLAPLTLSEEREQLLARTVSLPSILGGDLEHADIAAGWVKADDEAMLRLPVGIDGDGQPVELDLKESAQGGMGPHGLIVGATGSGKSELLRTLVTGLALTHSPDLLSFVLVDFKGGATFAQHTDLPHVAGLITNLADDLALVDRVLAALRGEQQRRQQLLKDAGNLDSVRAYQLRQVAGHTDIHGRPLEPLPYLLVIVDEFGELLTARPDFTDLFVQIGRVGRSLGMHLLLATQRLEEGRLRGLESHLSYRICLRTFTVMESRTAIGTTDAYRLPSIPGSAYLKVDESVYLRFRAAHISGPFVSAGQRAARSIQGPAQVTGYELRRAPDPAELESEQPQALPAAVTGPTEMQVAIDRLACLGQPVHQVWLPPLPPAISLDMLTGTATAQTARGVQATTWPFAGALKFPVGVTDLPERQQQEPVVLDFAARHGHLAIVGAPQTGRSTLLRTIMLSAMLTNSPDEAQFYCVDFGGGTLGPYALAPHVGAVTSRTDIPRVRRLLGDLHNLIVTRENALRDFGADSIAAFRALRDAGRLPGGTRAADVFCVIDNWGALRAEVDTADAYVLDIAARGLGVGVHLILAANRWADIRPNLRDTFNGRLELRLGDPTESEVSRQLSRRLPAGIAGRGLAAPGVFFQAALPRIDGQDHRDGLREAQEDILGKLATGWSRDPAPPVRVLPHRVTIAELSAPPAPKASAGVPIGIAESDLGTVALNLTDGDPHLLIFGEAGSGKTSLLRTWLAGLCGGRTPDQARLVVVDYRRGLMEEVPQAHLAGYAGDPGTARDFVEQVTAILAQRMPPPGITPRQLRARDWWEGPDIYLVIDDHDLIGTGLTTPLTDYIPAAREVGLHLVIARRTGGAGRAMMSDPLLSRVRDLGTNGLLLSGDPHEGALIDGQRPARYPPGRGVLVRRHHPPATIQTAVADSAH